MLRKQFYSLQYYYNIMGVWFIESFSMNRLYYTDHRPLLVEFITSKDKLLIILTRTLSGKSVSGSCEMESCSMNANSRVTNKTFSPKITLIDLAQM